MDTYNFIQRYWNDLKKLGKREKFIITGLLFVAFLVGFGGAIVIGKSSISVNISANNLPVSTPTPRPVALTLTTPNTEEIPTDSQFDVSIKLSTPDTGVEAANFIVYYDPKYVKPLSVTNGDFFANYPVKKIEKNFVKVSTTASFINNKITIPKGEGKVASITFDALAPVDNTLIYFDPDATIVASNGVNVISKMTSLNLSVK